jgi:hypothetical protein
MLPMLQQPALNDKEGTEMGPTSVLRDRLTVL